MFELHYLLLFISYLVFFSVQMRTSLYLSVVLASLFMCANNWTVYAQRKSALQENIDVFVSDLNRKCPVDYSDNLSLVSVSVDHGEKYLYFNYECGIPSTILSSDEQSEYSRKLRIMASEESRAIYNKLHSNEAFRLFDYTQVYHFYYSNGYLAAAAYLDYSTYPKITGTTSPSTSNSTRGLSEGSSSNHLKFLGRPITGEAYEFSRKLYDFELGHRLGDEIMLQGDFMESGHSDIRVCLTPISHTAYLVIVGIGRVTWDRAKKEYNNYQKILTKQYGKPAEIKEEFLSPYKEGKRQELDAFNNRKATWQTTYNAPGGRVFLRIAVRNELIFYVEIWYEDSENRKIYNLEQKEYMSTTVPTKITQSVSQSSNNKESVFPTPEEIEATNASLPVLVGEGTLFVKVEYDKNTKIQRFYYRFTENIDDRQITTSTIRQGKERMINALRQNKNSMARINAGMTYLYIYYSRDNRKLYEIRINKEDF